MIINITYPDGTQDAIGTESPVCLTDFFMDYNPFFQGVSEALENYAVKTTTTMRWNDPSGVMRYKRETELKEA